MADSIFTGAFWKATADRVIRTFAEAAAGILVVGNASGALDADWKGVVSASALAAILALLFSVAGNAVTKTGPSFTDSEQVVPPVSAEAAAEQGGPAPV